MIRVVFSFFPCVAGGGGLNCMTMGNVDCKEPLSR